MTGLGVSYSRHVRFIDDEGGSSGHVGVGVMALTKRMGRAEAKAETVSYACCREDGGNAQSSERWA